MVGWDVTARATGIERGDLGVGPGEMSVQQVTGLPGAVGIDFLDGKLEDGLQPEKLVGAFRDGHGCHTPRYAHCCFGFGFGFEFAADFPFSKCEAFWKSRGARLPRRPRPRSQAVLVGHNALERVVENHGGQRIQVVALHLLVPAPRDLDAEVEIEVDEDKVEVAETEDEDDMGARLQKQFEDGLIIFDEAMARTTAQ